MAAGVILYKKVVFRAFLYILGFFSTFPSFSQAKPNENVDWVLWSNEPSIRLYYASPNHSNLIQIKASLHVDSSLAAFLLFIQDTEHTPTWLDNAYDSKIIKQISHNENIFITYFNGVWPISPRNMVLKTYFSQQSDHSVVITSEDAGDYVPQIENSVRIAVNQATWHITPSPRQRNINIDYYLAVDPKVDLPNKVVLELSLSSMQRTLKNIIAQLPSSKWQAYQLSNIKELYTSPTAIVD